MVIVPSQKTISSNSRAVFHPCSLPFADLIIHSCFNASQADGTINNVSSYLDLSPLYGSSEEENVKKVRRGNGVGNVWNDVWNDIRIGFMPPSVVALAILFCRNHNVSFSNLLISCFLEHRYF
jgi:linoleate 10R-lipoxygenase